MSINTFNFLTLQEHLMRACGDFLEFDSTTNITTDNSIISTTLNQYDDGHNGTFDNQWAYITEGNNEGVERKTGLPGTTTYATATGTLTVMGAALAAESGAVTVRLSMYKPEKYRKAIIDACREEYPALRLDIDDMSLVSGNILPDASFESWTNSTTPEFYTASSGTFARTNTAGLIRGQRGSYSAKYTAGAASDYFYINSNSWPRLLDLMGRTIDFYTMAYPEVANDAWIQFYTVSNDGSTTQTETSSTTCPATTWTKLEIPSKAINDDLHSIEFRWGVTTNTKYCYFDNAFICGMSLSEYLLPDAIYEGYVDKALVQKTGYSDEIFYDQHPFITQTSGKEYDYDIISDGTYKYIKLKPSPPSERRIRLLGGAKLETLTDPTDTITLDDVLLPRLIARARMLFWEREAVPVSAEDKAKFEYEYAKAERDYIRYSRYLYMPVRNEKV